MTGECAVCHVEGTQTCHVSVASLSASILLSFAGKASNHMGKAGEGRAPGSASRAPPLAGAAWQARAPGTAAGHHHGISVTAAAAAYPVSREPRK